MSLPLRRIEVVEDELEGIGLSVLICVVIEVCHLCTSIEYINRFFFYHPIDILQIFELLSMGVFVMYVNGLC
jgi:hypothetical protein